MSDATPGHTPEETLAALLSEQRQCWQRGERVKVESLLRKLPAGRADNEALLDLIYQEFLFREERGEKPDVTGYQRRFPHLAEQLQVQFEADRELAGRHSKHSGSATTVDANVKTTSTTAAPVPAIPGYEILGEIGHGGMGVVYRARQVKLNRVVALKILRSAEYASPEELARFQREELAALAPDLAGPLRAELGQRNVGWDPLVRLPAGGPDRLSLFAPGQVELRNDVVVPVAAADNPALVLTNQASTSHDELTATFDEHWQDGPGIGLVLNAVRGHTLEINALAFSPDGQALASASGYREYGGSPNPGKIGMVKVWELTGQERFSYRPEKVGSVSLAYFPDGTALAVANEGEPRVLLLDPVTGKVRHQFVAHQGAGIGALAVSRDGQTLVTGSGVAGKSGEVRLWDTKTWQLRQTLTGFSTIVRRVALSPDGRFLAAAGRDRSVKVWDLSTGKEKLSGLPFFYEAADNSLCFTSDSRTLFAPFNLHETAGAVVGPILRWDVAGGRIKALEVGFAASGTTGVALAPGDATLAVASGWNGHLNLIDVKTRSIRLFQKETLPNQFTSLAFSPDGGSLAMGSLDGSVSVRQVDNGQLRLGFENQGYGFWVRPAATPGQPEAALATARSAPNGQFVLAVARNGRVLREQKVAASLVPPGPLQLLARRDGARLFFQVNALAPLEFEEVQPLPARGVFALDWPRGAGLKSLQALRRQLPEKPSPLERGDELFARSRYQEALASYREQEVAAGARDKEVSQEARLKAALCLVQLQRQSDAVTEFERLAGEDGARWPPVAACRLLELYLDLGRTKDVDLLFDRLTGLFAFEKLLPLVSKDLRDRLLVLFTGEATETRLMFRPRAIDLRNLDRAVKVCDYFQVPRAERLSLRLAYLRGSHLLGRLDLALQTAEDLLADDQYWGPKPDRATLIPVVETLGWILREKGQPQLALTRINQYLEGKPDEAQTFKPLLLERARIRIALKEWEQAEKDLDDCLQLKLGTLSYRQYAGAWLALGFLRQRRGDAAGAERAWKQGSVSGDILTHLPGVDAMFGAMLAALADKLSPAEGDAILETLVGRSSGLEHVALVKQQMSLPPGILRDMWRTPRGREWARRQAYQDLTYAESLRLPLLVLSAEYSQQSALPRELTREQEEVLWTATERLYLAYMEEKVLMPQLVGIGLTWKGTTNFLGWGGVSLTLDPSVRGPLAYVLGHRYLRLDKPAEALTFFETAARDAPADSTLRRLAEAEVARLKKGK
jgi:WD40 repeat protein/tetratricopeptide (TPR) repeat protein